MTVDGVRMFGRRLRRPAPGDPTDAGFALMMVMVTMLALMLFMTISVGSVVQNTKAARTQEDAKAAAAAAQAGIEEYIGRLRNDSEYWRRNNVDASNAAFSSTGRLIPGLTTGASYRYQVLNPLSDIDATGKIQLQVTGIASAGNGGRVISQTLRSTLTRIPDSTGAWKPQYAYFSNYEVGDPNQFPITPVNAKCSNYYYGSVAGTTTSTTARSGVSSNQTACPEIPWFTGDAVTGPVYSNDAQYLPGNPTFSVAPKSAYLGASSKYYWGAGIPTQAPQNAGVISNLPSSNSYMLKNTNPRPDGGTPGPGCLYKGATKITFSGTQMTVYSPLTTTTAAGCFNATQAATAQTYTTPPLIYVQSTTTGTCPLLGYPATNEFTGGTFNDSTGGTQYTPDYSCNRGTAYVSGTVSGAVTVGTENDIVIGGDLTTTNTTTDMIGLNAGADVWVYHPLRATSSPPVTTGPTVTQVTSCTGSTVTSGNTTTVITCSSQYCTGILVFGICSFGMNVYDRGVSTSTTTASYSNLLTTPVLNITASILTGSGSFIVQNFNRGAALSTATTNRLTVYGSISQKYRGPVAALATSTYATGYLVNYTFDSRLPNQLPPYFIDPGLTSWSQTLLTDS